MRRRGNRLGFMIFDLYLSLGLRHAYGLLYFVCLHYFLFDRSAMRAVLCYVRKRFKGAGFLARCVHGYRVLLAAGRNLVDLRQFDRDPGKVSFECDNTDIEAALAQGKGVLFLTSHAGNWQLMMRELPRLGRDVCVVMLPEENPAVREYLQVDRGDLSGVKVLNPGDGLESGIMIAGELADGGIVSMMGDRLPGPGGQILECPFYGSPMALPKGPFAIAEMCGCCVMQLFIERLGACSYRLRVGYLHPGDNLAGREERVRDLAGNYLAAIEEYLDKYPYEWNPRADRGAS
ncbi:MAG: lysophospholipid acyltransferase family protein [Victivallales bacterium]|nr:lysophospholipid acyltransferase family protein [Victivallales bacterium]